MWAQDEATEEEEENDAVFVASCVATIQVIYQSVAIATSHVCWLHATAHLCSTTPIEMFIGKSKYQAVSGPMSILLALLLCRVVRR